MADVNVLVLVGSLRKASVNRQLAELAVESAPEGVVLRVFDGLGEVPFYNEDIDNEDIDNEDIDGEDIDGEDIDGESVPEPARALRAAAEAADAALVVTPEYNGSIPGVLKNAIDWLSRPWGQSALKDKPLAVVGAALGRYGGKWAHDETRKSFGVAGPRVIDDLELSVPAALLDGRHPRENAEVAGALRAVIEKLAAAVG
ncbi:FMN reductase [Mycolicibacterium litorale]|uniref:FMN reductase n=1 Tax=Mycolicibacterium litorale TaxID=758802 RepID=A0A6S6P2V1_9MYCO|nr:NAD(P)H-dependent oxidoreductase [Mycolicibacterium litorale]BCI52472.1 FMN reductase [Mycolicibacterium litorale]